jgi:hypothetical protein
MRPSLALPLALALAAAGCDGGPAKVPVHPVTGQVYYDGKPAAGVQVFLFPTSAPTVPEIPAHPHGVTGPDGRFTLGTYADADGAAEGSYQVVLFWPDAKSEEEETKQDRLLGWYTVARSRLTATIKPGANELPLRLPAVKVPPSESGGGVPGRN